jgi:hypothetical protein
MTLARRAVALLASAALATAWAWPPLPIIPRVTTY